MFDALEHARVNGDHVRNEAGMLIDKALEMVATVRIVSSSMARKAAAAKTSGFRGVALLEVMK
jgi:hypothetical protein